MKGSWLLRLVLPSKRRYRVGSVCSGDGHTFDLNDIIQCHAWSREFVYPGSMCKREEASVVSK